MAATSIHDPRPLLYLDTSALKRPFDVPGAPGDRVEQEQQAVAGILRRVTTGQARLLNSFWLVRENLADRDALRPASADRILQLAWACALQTAAVDAFAERLVRLGVGAADALHVAVAQIGGATHFLSADDRLRRRLGRPVFLTLLTMFVADPVALEKELGI